jgi:bifunctional oligoribonuclease and PAP phosphatase NrnA
MRKLLAGGIDPALAQAGWDLIDHASDIVILAHENPDPDALGSALGLARALISLGKHATVACADPVPESFTFLADAGQVVTSLASTAFDLVIALDAGELSRYGRIYDENRVWLDQAVVLNIDHHISTRGCGKVNIVDPIAAATAELLTCFLLSREIEPDATTAQALLSGIITDTRSFEFDATTERTLAAGSYLVSRGGVPETIIKPMYRMKPLAKARLWGLVLTTLASGAGGKLVWATLLREHLTEAGATSDMDDGLPSYLMDIEGVAISVIFRERDEAVTRVSIRAAAPYDAAAICGHFGGGGHLRAAGCTISEPVAVAREQVVAYIEAILTPTSAMSGE